MRLNINPGEKYGRLTILRDVNNGSGLKYECKCECGKVVFCRPNRLKRGRVKSCGCLRIDGFVERNTTHNMFNHPIYRTWLRMKDRCYNKNSTRYKNYGGRGIKICDRWLIFENFFNDVKDTYVKGLSIDRFPDKNGDYQPFNFRWATNKMQARNKTTNRCILINGENITVAELSEISGVRAGTILYRLNNSLPLI